MSSKAKKLSFPNAYTKTGVFLWEQINAIDNEDRDSIEQWNDVVIALTPLFDQHLPKGFMFELDMWLGLKRDAPEAFADFGEGFDSYPEVFTGKAYIPPDSKPTK